MPVTAKQHVAAMRTASRLSEWFRKSYHPMATKVQPQKVIKLLQQAGVRFVVMGTHGLNGYRRETRATHDIDLLVEAKHHKKATRALLAAFPNLEVKDYPVVTRFLDPTTGLEVIDLMKPADELYKAVFSHSVPMKALEAIPTIEFALAAKYAAMISPNRRWEKKFLDAADFIEMVKTRKVEWSRTKLMELGELVYQGGGKELLRYLDDAAAGRRIEI